MSGHDIQEILRKWFEAKEKISILEDKIEKYKKIIEAEMNATKKEYVLKGDYTVERRRITRSTINKKNVPSEIWNKYSTKSTCTSLYLKKNQSERKDCKDRKEKNKK